MSNQRSLEHTHRFSLEARLDCEPVLCSRRRRSYRPLEKACAAAGPLRPDFAVIRGLIRYRHSGFLLYD